MLKKQAEVKIILQDKLQNFVKKIKYLEKQLQHVPTTAIEQLEASTTTKRGFAYFYSFQEQGLQKNPKWPRLVTK